MTAWPWPEDSTLERHKRVAQIYRHCLQIRLPNECANLDAQMAAHGQTWVVGSADTHEPDDLLTAELAADLMHVARRTIYSWREKGLRVVETPDGPRYRVSDLRVYVAEQRLLRARKTKG